MQSVLAATGLQDRAGRRSALHSISPHGTRAHNATPAARPPGRTRADEQPDGLDGAALLAALRSLRNGDFRVRLPEGQVGVAGAVAEAFNDVAELNQRSAQELRRISRAVGREGRISHRVSIGPAGSWARNEAAVNQLVFDLTEPMLEVSRVLDAVARGDLSQRMARRSTASHSRASTSAWPTRSTRWSTSSTPSPAR